MGVTVMISSMVMVVKILYWAVLVMTLSTVALVMT